MNKSMTYVSSLYQLVKRNILVYLRNSTTVIFSLMAPVLILAIYTLFMGDIQVDMLGGVITEVPSISDETMRTIVNVWMIPGIVAISCLTVALNGMLVMIEDKERGTVNDFTASPLKPVTRLLSYVIAAFILTFVICLIFLLIGLAYLAITTGIYFQVVAFFELLLILLLSSLSAVLGLMCVMTFFKTIMGVSAFTGIFSALIGFLIGAYLPVSMLPIGIQNLANLMPGSYSTGLFRRIFMDTMFSQISDLSPSFIEQIKDVYSFELVLFGQSISRSGMYIYLTGSIIVFFFIYLLIDAVKTKVLCQG